MKVFYTVLILAAVLAISCSSKNYKEVDPAAFNTKIASRTDLEKPKDVMKLYYGIDSLQQYKDLSIAVKKRQDERFEITLVHDRLEDDSMRGMQIVMVVQKSGNVWIVHSIHENWKCWEGRGHTEWGVEMCN